LKKGESTNHAATFATSQSVAGGVYTGNPFTNEDFAEWYSCPQAKLRSGQTYVDPSNWSGDDTLRSAKALWYFIAVTQDGKRVKGEAVIEVLAGG
jgi:hypothetical protein